MSERSLDFSVLHQPLSGAEIESYKQFRKSTKPVRSLVLWLPFVAVGIMFFGFVFNSSSSLRYRIENVITFVIVMAVFVGIGFALYQKSERKRARLYKFALVNGIEYRIDESQWNHDGLIFGLGHSRKMTDKFVLKDGTELANYRYTTGSGKNQQTHPWGYAVVNLTRKVPHMVLDSKKNNYFGRFSNLPQSFGKDQHLSLEGNFDNYFKLYAPEQYKTDALYVFTPDVMQAVVDAGDDYDMEVIDDKLYVYHQGSFDFASENQWRKLLKIIEAICTELHDQTKRYADENVGDREKNIVAVQGRRLRTNTSVVVYIAVILGIVFFIFQFSMILQSWFI